jgi:hypothetical protein
MKPVTDYHAIFTTEELEQLLPHRLTDDFFEALLGDAKEGAYDIRLAFKGASTQLLKFELELHRRPGKCLACSLTYGLPKVFTCHPIINLKGLVQRITERLDGQAICGPWKLGRTLEISRDLHVVPLVIALAETHP